jgi:hypothetical protein
MVWGMALPEGYGEFWPSGDFENDHWRARLKAYFSEHASDGQKALFDDGHGNAAHWYASYAIRKFIDEHNGEDRVPFTPVEPHEPPRYFDTAKGHKTLGSLIMLTSKMLAVDAPLKAVIERLEPGVQQFFPIEIRMPRRKVYPASYYLLVMRYLDAFSPADTKSGSVMQSESGILTLDKTKAGMGGPAMRKALFDDAHLWRERRFFQELICFSDALRAEIEKAGLRIPKHYKLKEMIDASYARSQSLSDN